MICIKVEHEIFLIFFKQGIDMLGKPIGAPTFIDKEGAVSNIEKSCTGNASALQGNRNKCCNIVH